MQPRDLAPYNEQNNSNISNESKILFGLLNQRYNSESTETHSYKHHIASHAHHEVMQTWHQQMHERSHHRRHHHAEASNSEIKPTFTLTGDPRTLQTIIEQNEQPTSTFDYSRISLSNRQHESNLYSHSSIPHSSRSQRSAAASYGANELLSGSKYYHSFQHPTENSAEATQETLARTIAKVANQNADRIGTVGDCAKGPRLTLKSFGLNLPEVYATEQGRILESTGLFQRVSRDQVRPGDYGYRHWKPSVISSHGGVDKGDAFIVTNIGRHRELIAANDHHFVVPGDGGRYRDTTFLRPTAEFYQRYAALNSQFQKSKANA